MFNPMNWWALRKKRQELERLRLKYGEFASIPGETTRYTSEIMWRLVRRIAKALAEIEVLEGKLK